MNFIATVGTTPTLIKPDLPSKVVYIYNNGNETVYWGWDSRVTTTDGFPLAAGAYLFLTVLDGDPCDKPIYGISAGGSDEMRVMIQ